MTAMTAAAALAGRAGAAPAGVGCFATSDGTVLAARETGVRPATATLILLHGWTLDHTLWDGVADLLAERTSLRVLAYSHRGHGWSDAGPAPTTIDHLARDLADLVAANAPGGPVLLAGHSIGGMTIMAFFESFPEVAAQVAGVCLVATSAGPVAEDLPGIPRWLRAPALGLQQALWRRQARSVAPVAAIDPRRIERNLRFAPGPKPDWAPADLRRTAAMIARSHPATTAALGQDLMLHDRLHAVRRMAEIPVTVLAGGNDVLCPVPHAREMAEAVPGSTLIVLPGAGHMLPSERPEQVATHLAALAALTSRAVIEGA